MTDFLNGLESVLTWQPLLFMFIGILGGIVVGAIPGLTATMTIAILLPFTFVTEPLPGVCLLLGIYSGAVYAGSIPAILLRIPGTPSSAATLLDGHPMTLQGKGGLALTISLVASSIGGIIGGALLLAFAPTLAGFALKFGPAEFFMLAVFALALIASMSEGAMVKGLISGLVGLLIATVGTDPINGITRLTFGVDALQSGLGFIPVLIGLFGVAEALVRFEQHIHHRNANTIAPGSFRLKWSGLRKLMPGITYSSLIGFGVGVLPGTGGDIGSFIGHNEVKRLSRNTENFGKGDPRGLAAAESANNASVPGTLAPTLILGIPGNSAAAVLIGALTVHGLQPGPGLFAGSPDLVYGIFIALLVIPAMMLVVGLAGIRSWGQITRIPTEYLWPSILALSVVGAYALQSSAVDVMVTIAAGVLGYFMLKGGFPPAPLVIGLIVGPLAETGFRRATIISSGSYEWIFQPIPLVMLILSVLTVGWSLYRSWAMRKKPANANSENREAEDARK
ncbi:tripartite tricarboxylate transporter permease [Arthrobacter tumbae]|uniref:tripartite tricarboxylate transporter permease n=1 Tax=Arthrobacter tumbae TaxID=163874 RepID=UPI00195853E6|nr:tripartite tricarboxylate transporter permease [Arthrobacter tumbae]MBM7781949.1 putative tricarboxylic transport membrane protein [Arthrobacter tumbae]